MFGISYGNSFAQDYRFSQFYSTPLYLNPALTGVDNHIYAAVNMRSQRQGINSYQTSQFSFIYPIVLPGRDAQHVGGVGITAFRDVAGSANEVKTTAILASGGYNFKLDFYGTHNLSFGLQAGWLQYAVDFGALTWGSQVTYNGFDRSIVPEEEFRDQINVFNANTGVIYGYNSKNRRYKANKDYKLFLGLAVNNLNRPSQTFLADPEGKFRVPHLYKVHGGAEFEMSRVASFSPNFIILSQNQQIQANMGGYLTYKFGANNRGRNATSSILDMHIGSWYRYADSFIFLLGFSNDSFNAAISYDLNRSANPFGIPGQGAMEVGLAYIIGRQKDVRRFSTPLF